MTLVQNTFRINGTLLTAQPDTHQWIPQDRVDVDGNGAAIYAPVQQYELQWGLMSATEFEQLQSFYAQQVATGTVVATLPKYRSSTYQFESYTGCVLYEPTRGGFFENYVEDVSLIIARVRV